MRPESAEVDRYLATLDHPMKVGVEQLRSAILASNEAITEHIKWNAPSFCYEGVDRVTFRLKPADGMQLIFHRGAKVRKDAADFAFDDSSGLLTWLAPDRAVVELPDTDAVTAHQTAIIELINRWVVA